MKLSDVTETMRARVLADYEADPNGGCWLWTGATNSYGYGMVYGHRRALSAHRVAYVVHNGSFDSDLVVRHACDVRCCINPDHLSLGTHADNMQDAVLRGRLYTARRRFNRLDPDIRDQALSRVRSGEGVMRVAADLGIEPNSIRYWQKKLSKEAERG